MNDELFGNNAVQNQGLALIVDDDPVMVEMLSAVIEDSYRIIVAGSGEDCLDQVAGATPDLILLDIEMPGIDGYETARRLRKHENTRAVPIIFVSSHDTLEERVMAYEAGGDDFLIKPFDPEELMRKISVAARIKSERDKLVQEKAAMQKMAMDIMASMGDTGCLLKFLRASLSSTDYPTLVRRMLEAQEDWGLDASVQIRTPDGALTYNQAGPATPLEVSVFEKMVGMGRIFHFKSRMIVNYDHVSVMVTNMPDETSMIAGRIRDNAAILAEGAEIIAGSIAVRQEAAHHAESLRRVFTDSSSTLEELRDLYRKQQVDTRMLLDQMIVDVEKTFVFLGLTDRQESVLSETVHASADRILSLFEQGLKLDEKFARILEVTRGG